MTIVEVLFSILVTAVGLLGAIAIFPVASAQARRAKQNDASAASGRASVHTFDTMGMRRPFDRWYTWNTAVNPNQFVAATPATFDNRRSYCIDTRFIVRNTSNFPDAAFFPYNSTLNPAGTAPNINPRMLRVAFFPGTLVPGLVPSALDHFDRQNNVVPLGAPSFGRNILLADSIFVFNDDLAFLRPGLDDVSKLNIPGITNDRSLPSFQNMARSPNQRPTQGHMSWMATLVPKIDMYSGLGSDEFVLSIVVFNDRPTDLHVIPYTTIGGNENLLERVVQASFPPALGLDGSTGGEVLLSWNPPGNNQNDALAEERMKIRPTDWILLGGNQVFGNPPNPLIVPRFQWYRVTHVDEIDWNAPGFPNTYTRFVTLMGPDWNINLVNQQATIVQGVVAVYEKTIRLDYGSTF